MRLLLTITLVAMLASCPILCGAADSALGLFCCAHDSSCGEGTIPHPINDEDCLCNGALKADDGRLDRSVPADGAAIAPLTGIDGFTRPSLTSHPFPTTPSRADGHARPGRIHALIQHYRC